MIEYFKRRTDLHSITMIEHSINALALNEDKVKNAQQFRGTLNHKHSPKQYATSKMPSMASVAFGSTVVAKLESNMEVSQAQN